MIQELHAIYEHGVLRPLTPLNLPESTEVIVTLRERGSEDEPEKTNHRLQSLLAALDGAHNDAPIGRLNRDTLYDR
jgi:predicted DNA-binding antitoxin AbrB/MazE fold protein